MRAPSRSAGTCVLFFIISIHDCTHEFPTRVILCALFAVLLFRCGLTYCGHCELADVLRPLGYVHLYGIYVHLFIAPRHSSANVVPRCVSARPIRNARGSRVGLM